MNFLSWLIRILETFYESLRVIFLMLFFLLTKAQLVMKGNVKVLYIVVFTATNYFTNFQNFHWQANLFRKPNQISELGSNVPTKWTLRTLQGLCDGQWGCSGKVKDYISGYKCHHFFFLEDKSSNHWTRGRASFPFCFLFRKTDSFLTNEIKYQ